MCVHLCKMSSRERVTCGLLTSPSKITLTKLPQTQGGKKDKQDESHLKQEISPSAGCPEIFCASSLLRVALWGMGTFELLGFAQP